VRFRAVVWRAHHPRWAFKPASGQGAALHGGRFNRVGVPALYASLRFETAWLEAQQAFPFKAQPMTLCGYQVRAVSPRTMLPGDERRPWRAYQPSRFA
jgi:RES domain-containing protein